LAKHMRDKGFDPADGCFFVMPISMKTTDNWGLFGPPYYVKFSNLVEYPIMIRGNL